MLNLSDDIFVGLKKVLDASNVLTQYIKDNDLSEFLIKYIENHEIKDNDLKINLRGGIDEETRHNLVVKKMIRDQKGKDLPVRNLETLEKIVVELIQCEKAISGTIKKEKNDYNKQFKDINDKRKRPLGTIKMDISHNDNIKKR